MTRTEQILDLLKGGKKTAVEICGTLNMSKRMFEKYVTVLRRRNAIYTIQLGRWIGYELRD